MIAALTRYVAFFGLLAAVSVAREMHPLVAIGGLIALVGLSLTMWED